MLRHVPQPVNPRRFARGCRVQSPRHGLRDERLPLFGEQFQLAFFEGQYGVEFGGFAVQEGGDLLLFAEGWNSLRKITDKISACAGHLDAISRSINNLDDVVGKQRVKQEAIVYAVRT